MGSDFVKCFSGGAIAFQGRSFNDGAGLRCSQLSGRFEDYCESRRPSPTLKSHAPSEVPSEVPPLKFPLDKPAKL